MARNLRDFVDVVITTPGGGGSNGNGSSPGTVGFSGGAQSPSAIVIVRTGGVLGAISVDVVLNGDVIDTVTWADGEQGPKTIDLSGVVQPGDTLTLENPTGGAVINQNNNEIVVPEPPSENGTLRFVNGPQYLTAIMVERVSGSVGAVSAELHNGEQILHTFEWEDGEDGALAFDASGGDTQPGDILTLVNAAGGATIDPLADEITAEAEPAGILRFGEFVDYENNATVLLSGDRREVEISALTIFDVVLETLPPKFGGDQYYEMHLNSFTQLTADITNKRRSFGLIMANGAEIFVEQDQNGNAGHVDDNVHVQIGYVNAYYEYTSVSLGFYPVADFPMVLMFYQNVSTLESWLGVDGYWFDFETQSLVENFEDASSLPLTGLISATPTVYAFADDLADDNQLSVDLAVYGSAADFTYVPVGTPYDESAVPESAGVITFVGDKMYPTPPGYAYVYRVARTGGSIGGVSVELSYEGSVEPPITLTWNDGDSTAQIGFVSVAFPGADNDSVLTISNPTGGAVLGQYQTATFGGQSVIEFTSAAGDTSFGDPGGPKDISIQVMRQGPLEQPATCGWEISSISSGADFPDFEATSGTVHFLPGEEFSSITVTKTTNSGGWNPGTIVVNLQENSPSGSIGPVNQHEHTWNFLF